MKKSISKNITNLIYVFILLIMFILIIYQKYKNNEMEYKLKMINARSQALIKDITLQSNLDGKYLWDIFNIKKEKLDSIISMNKIGDNFILFCVDSITCISCFNFHIDNINQLSKIKTIVYSPSHPEYVKSFLRNSVIYGYEQNTDNNIDKIFSRSMIINLVNTTGQIIYSDVADKLNYDKSRKFYRKIKQYVKTNKIK